MKKILLVFASLIMVISLCACGNGGSIFADPTPVPIPEVSPTDILSAEDVATAIGNAYTPVLKDGVVTQDGNVKTALYTSDPIGQGDPVEISIAQFNSEVSKESVWYSYDYDRVKRPSAEMVTELGEDAFIAFPSIHIYDRGCYITITAGSGSNDNQKNLLINLASTAVAKFEQIMPQTNDQGQVQQVNQ